MLTKVIRKLKRDARQIFGRYDAYRQGIQFYRPNYIFKNWLDRNSAVVDVGCADDADLSQFMIKRFGLRSYGVDPTRKHQGALAQLEQQMAGRFQHLAAAVSAKSGTLVFNESADNVSGSLIASHKNVSDDRISQYEVRCLSLVDLLAELSLRHVDYLKLDLEGAEYDLIRNADLSDFGPIRQLFVEFHHFAVTDFTKSDTLVCVEKLKRCGFQCFTLDDTNYLFYRSRDEDLVERP